MWSRLFSLLFFFIALCAGLYFVIMVSKSFLPDHFRIYVLPNGQEVVAWPASNTTEKILPTVNHSLWVDGCYIACYSHDNNGAIYSVEQGTNMTGLIRVRGEYHGKMCMPHDFESKDISIEPFFTNLCEKYFPDVCTGKTCWASRDTADWFYISSYK